MGAYLNRPVVEKEQEAGAGSGFTYACTTMQGWRANQEDAHNCVLNLEDGWHMFAVYDGHGGSEVSKFVAKNFPDFLKTRNFSEAENIDECLQTAFVDFDDIIRSENSMVELKDIANSGKKKKQPAVDCQDEADRIDTIEESALPLQELIQRYGRGGGGLGRSLLSAFLQKGGGDVSSDSDEDEEEEEGAEGEEAEEGSGDAEKAEGAEAEAEKEEEEKEETSSDGDKKKSIKKRQAKSPIQSKAKKSKPESADEEEEAKEDDANVSSSSASKAPAVEAPDAEDESDQDFVADEEEAEDEQSDEEMEEADLSDFVIGAGSAETPGEDSGTTACVCLIGGGKVIVANAGDSRAVLCRDGKAIDLSVDHKPEDPVETARIHAAGGAIEEGRVNGGLNLSRALGDHAYKKNGNLPLKDQMITALPDIKIETLTPEDEFVVVACDGIWNSMESQQVVDFVKNMLDAGDSSQDVCDALCDACLADSTDGDGTGCDNMTVIVAVIARPTI